MDWKLFAQVVMTFAIAVFGGWLGHILSGRRDLTNERRKLRIQYLLEAYRRLEAASERRQNHEQYWTDLESAVADIQLLGTPHQASLARQLAFSMAQNSTAPTDPLIFDLRQSLRYELRLPAISERVIMLRFTSKAAE